MPKAFTASGGGDGYPSVERVTAPRIDAAGCRSV
jgi:hypothetical protein